MIKITKKVEYALMGLKFISTHEKGEFSSAREICDDLNIPFDTTAKVLQLMMNHHILASHKGVKGGYYLARPLEQITYRELVEIIEGRSFMMDCHEGPCELIHSCNISQPIKRLNDYLLTIFNSITLSELLCDDNLLALKKLEEPKVDNCPILTKEQV